ncbi:MAG: ribosome-associated heat shock protein Hsp15 [Lonepinella koalarum]|nr:ribosome-associated heat shock protein Hsp15 [Lonepinella koalarum]
MAKNPLKHDIDDNIRLDKWLWAARFYKTRTLAKEMIDGGKVHYNGNRAKPNKTVEIGAIIKLRQGNNEKEVKVTALSTQRRGATEAQLLYIETEKSIQQREKNTMARKMQPIHSEHRPNKKERRELLKFKLTGTN